MAPVFCPVAVVGLGTLFASHAILHTACTGIALFKSKPTVAAFNIINALCFLGFAVFGSMAWWSPAAAPSDGNLPDRETRVYGSLEAGQDVAQAMAMFQIYAVAVCLYDPRLRNPLMLAHHSLTAILGAVSVELTVFQHYALFFMGVSEWSSIPLSLMDLGKSFPQFATKYPAFHSQARVSFALSFLVLRCGYWPYVSLVFWRDCIAALESEDRPGAMWPVVLYMASNIFLTAMQFFWGQKVANGLMKALARGSKKEPRAKE